MNDDIIPEDVRRFFLNSIDSIAQWEGLLLLRADIQKEWTEEVVARNLYIHEPEAADLLTKLLARGFLRKQGQGYSYHPAAPEMEPLVARAAELYKRYLLPVTHLIHSKAENRIQQFADAFRLKKE